ncbi:DUF3089 domain-containing protein [Sphingorhabdus sp. EL138]|uniref:DUF3089 domain-containing protein n=1 Tax=Sphingorhabdus sp. EL138 TaxID=2073156 RepID=UPI0025D7EE0B|nr:DUF3089 domain-containing protein [Sphingorhabdus sp. EL138]
MITTLLIAAAAATNPIPNDYSLAQNWLCRPGRRDACTVNTDITAIAADGTIAVRKSTKARNPKADCFFVYPTLSSDEGGNSDMVANDEERRVIETQFARFGETCRTFAPIYRSVTISALRALLMGKPISTDRELNYNDVRDAWRHYLATDNQGRPFVLLGHSQGAGLLKRLVAEEIDGKPTQKLMLSAMLAGTNVLVAKGKELGGDFKSTPLCRKSDQTGCVLAWVTFREAAVPPINARFGRTDIADREVACTNPAKLSGGNAPLQAVLPRESVGADMAVSPTSWTSDQKLITTGHVSVPGLYSGQCVSANGANYLAVRLSLGLPNGRVLDPGGDLKFGPMIAKDWGLHLLDINIVQQDMVDLIGIQLSAWEKSRP